MELPTEQTLLDLPHDAVLLLEQYATTICKCVIKNTRSRSAIIGKYDERWHSMKDGLESKGIFHAQTCVFDLLWQASEDNKHAIAFLKFMDSTVEGALTRTDGKACTQLKDLVVKMVTSFGKKESGYRHHFAELAVIAKLTEDKSIHLKCIEKKLSNGCRIDFEILKDGNPALVEVYNINFDITRTTDADGLKTFFERRLLHKINAKLKLFQDAPSPIMFVPVLWGDIMKLKRFVGAFEYFQGVSFLSPFMFVAQYQNIASGEIVYRFESLYRDATEQDISNPWSDNDK